MIGDIRGQGKRILSLFLQLEHFLYKVNQVLRVIDKNALFIENNFIELKMAIHILITITARLST
jgi:hypothetical protein